MTALEGLRKGWVQLRELQTRFSDLVARERRWLVLSAVMLGGEILALLLAPWPIKYLFDGLLMPKEGVTLWGVPEGYPADHQYAFVAWVCGALLLISIFGGVCAYYRQIWAATAGQRIVFRLRKRLYSHLHGLSLSFHRDRRLGDLLVRITGDIPMLRDVLSESFIDLIGRFVMVAAFITVLFFLDPILALISVVVLVVVTVLSGIFGRKIVRVARRQREMEGILAYTAGESLSAVTLVKAYGREEQVVRRFARQNRSSLRRGLKGTKLQAALSRWVELVFATGVAIVLAFGVIRFVSGSGLTGGDLLVFLSYVRGLNKPLRRLARLSSRIGKAAACGERIAEILSIEPEEVDAPDAVDAPRFEGSVAYHDVSFSYDGEVPAVDGVSLQIDPGQRIGLVGRNGAGKTTLMQLLLRFQEPDSGSIRLDGRDARSFTIASVREQISMALQDTFLFGMSIRDNILFAAPDAPDEEILAMLDTIGGDFVRRLPEGLDTEVAEGGENFSGGERRKIALAGALLRPSSILVLDEPTTHVDRASRDDLLRRLPEATTGRTTLVITHDPEMLAWLDGVIYLEEGRVAGRGGHQDLQAQSIGYRALFPGTASRPEGETP